MGQTIPVGIGSLTRRRRQWDTGISMSGFGTPLPRRRRRIGGPISRPMIGNICGFVAPIPCIELISRNMIGFIAPIPLLEPIGGNITGFGSRS
jgi:hypothetical protein